MFGGSTSTLSWGLGAARHLFGTMLAVMALFLMTAAFDGEAKACPPETKADSAGSLTQTVKKAAALTAGMVWVTNHVPTMPSSVDACCGSSHAGGSGCQSACASCAVAIAVASDGALSPGDAATCGASEPGALPSAKTPPEFRPPRHMA
jgi:hypothetical protein